MKKHHRLVSLASALLLALAALPCTAMAAETEGHGTGPGSAAPCGPLPRRGTGERGKRHDPAGKGLLPLHP